jgi:hypothetical protein
MKTKTKKTTKRASGSLDPVVGEREAALLVERALAILNQPYITDNQHRLGALGSGDIDIIRRYLSSAKVKLSNAELSESARENQKL